MKSNKLAVLFTGTAAVLMLSGTSAFADSRHRAETRTDSQPAQQTQRRDTAQFNRGQSNQRWDRSQTQAAVNQSNQRWDRSQTQVNQSNAYRYDTRSQQAYRGSYAQQAYRGSYTQANRGSYAQPVRNESRSFSGRVSRVERYNGGFRVWVGGAQYPFFIGADRWARFPLRVGLNVSLGGYWDPLGYYNVYNVGPYAYSTGGDIHGVIESVDYRSGTAVLRDDVSGSFVTVLLRGNDPRLGDLRTGDYVDLAGAWSRSGVFAAVNVANLRPAGYGYGGPAPQYDAPPPY